MQIYKQKNLLFAFVIMLLMTMLIGINSILSFQNLTNHTQNIYEHPYIVSTHVHKIDTNIVLIQRSMQDLILAETPEAIAQEAQRLHEYERETLNYFDLIHSRYLGDKNQITSIKEQFIHWHELQHELIHLKESGNNKKVIAMTQNESKHYTDNLLLEMRTFSDFADKKALTFLHTAQEEAKTNKNFLLISLLIVLSIGMYLAWNTIKSINNLINHIRMNAVALNAKNNEIQTVINSIIDWIWVVDENAKYTYVSKQVYEQLGYTPEELLGKTPFDFMEKEEAQRVKSLFNKYVEKRVPFIQLRNTNRHKDGSLVIIESSGNPIFDEKGNFKGYQGSDRDVTQSVTLQKDVQNQEIMLLAQSRLAQMGELISMIAHQWRQPLSTISAISAEIEIMLEINEYDLSNAQQQETFFNFIHQRHKGIQEQVQHLSQTINDFREFYKPNQKPSAEILDTTIHKAIRILDPMIRSHSINLQTTLNAKEPQEIFVSRIVQTLVNILKNAVDAFDEVNQEQPFIHISSTMTSKHSTITIKDNAGGIPAETLEHIFDPYFSTKDDKNGTGLGLYMSKIIIEKHHQGSITATSKHNETTFTITIPRKT